MYNDAGVTIYAVKNLNVNGTDEDLDFEFTVGKTMGATHLTAELPAPSDTSTATLKRVGDMALKHGMFAAYHSHLQGSITAFDEAFAASKGNKSNVDFGHYVAAGEKGGTPMDFLNKFHDRIGSFHLKDRTLPEHCSLNLAWGTGRYADQGNSAVGAEKQMAAASHDRVGIRNSQGLRRREGSPEVPRLLQIRTGITIRANGPGPTISAPAYSSRFQARSFPHAKNRIAGLTPESSEECCPCPGSRAERRESHGKVNAEIAERNRAGYD